MSTAFLTLVLNDAYVAGAMVLCHSLRKTNTTHHIVCMVGEGVTAERRQEMANAFDLLVDVPTLSSEDATNLAFLGRPELGPTLTKIYAWRLTQFTKCVYLDADTLVLKNIDDLFDRPAFAAAPDIGWPDCFNSGVFVFAPSLSTFSDLYNLSQSVGSFDGGDQGLLNEYFSDWSQQEPGHRLPFTDNLTSNAAYGYAPAFKRYGDEVRVVHFIGALKPWHGPPSADFQGMSEFHQMWWNMRAEMIGNFSESGSIFFKSAATQIKSYLEHGLSVDQSFVQHADAHIPFLDPDFRSSLSADEVVARISHLSTTSTPATTPSKGTKPTGSPTTPVPATTSIASGYSSHVIVSSPTVSESTSVPPSNIHKPAPLNRQPSIQAETFGHLVKSPKMSRKHQQQKPSPSTTPEKTVQAETPAKKESKERLKPNPLPPVVNYSPHEIQSKSPTRRSSSREDLMKVMKQPEQQQQQQEVPKVKPSQPQQPQHTEAFQKAKKATTPSATKKQARRRVNL
eukprot:m.100837 g.100837  ORF g.100837 m.100837 type:complete len:510 (+) comp9051_c2_seq1:84-1613(+)